MSEVDVRQEHREVSDVAAERRDPAGHRAPGASGWLVRRRGAILAVVAAVIVLLLVPGTAGWITPLLQYNAIRDYAERVVELPLGQAENDLQTARLYNGGLAGVAPTGNSETDSAYRDALTVPGSNLLGFASFPESGVDLPIHRPGAAVQTSLEHVYGSSLPAGGESSHAVLKAPAGLGALLSGGFPSLAVGDLFSVQELDQTAWYRVDQSWTVDADELLTALPVEFGVDQVSLVIGDPDNEAGKALVLRGARVEAPTASPNGVDRVLSEPYDLSRVAWWSLTLAGGVLVLVLLAWVLRRLGDRSADALARATQPAREPAPAAEPREVRRNKRRQRPSPAEAVTAPVVPASSGTSALTPTEVERRAAETDLLAAEAEQARAIEAARAAEAARGEAEAQRVLANDTLRSALAARRSAEAERDEAVETERAAATLEKAAAEKAARAAEVERAALEAERAAEAARLHAEAKRTEAQEALRAGVTARHAAEAERSGAVQTERAAASLEKAAAEKAARAAEIEQLALQAEREAAERAARAAEVEQHAKDAQNAAAALIAQARARAERAAAAKAARTAGLRQPTPEAPQAAAPTVPGELPQQRASVAPGSPAVEAWPVSVRSLAARAAELAAEAEQMAAYAQNLAAGMAPLAGTAPKSPRPHESDGDITVEGCPLSGTWSVGPADREHPEDHVWTPVPKPAEPSARMQWFPSSAPVDSAGVPRRSGPKRAIAD